MSERSRDRWTTRSRRYESIRTPLSGPVIHDVINQTTSFRQSEIIDVADNYMGSNPVQHTQYYVSPFPFVLPSAMSKIDGSSAIIKDSDFYVGGRPQGAPFSYVPNWSALLQEIVDDSTGVLPSQVQTIINVIEFGQLKSIIPGACKAARKIIKSGFSKKSLKELASQHLAYSFGVAPLVGEIKGLLSIRQTIRARIKQLEARNGVVTQIRKRESVKYAEPGFYARGNSDTGHRIEQDGEWEIDAQACLSASCRSFFVNDGRSQAQLVSQALGLGTPLSTIWELIPFSFVADWLLPIGDSFAKLESKIMDPQVVRHVFLNNFVWSIKQKGAVILETTVRSKAYPGWDGLKLQNSTVQNVQYLRGVGVPPANLIPPIKWSVNRTALSISLVLQRVL